MTSYGSTSATKQTAKPIEENTFFFSLGTAGTHTKPSYPLVLSGKTMGFSKEEPEFHPEPAAQRPLQKVLVRNSPQNNMKYSISWLSREVTEPLTSSH